MKHPLPFFSSLGFYITLLLSGLVGTRNQAQAQAYGSCGSKDPGGNAAQAGMYAEYYAGYFANSPAFFSAKAAGLTRIDSVVNFPNTGSWSTTGSITPPAGNTVANPTVFSVRERGEIFLPTAGSYTFYLTSDDGSYLWVDGDASQQVPNTANATVNNGNTHGSQTVQATVTGLAAGWHNLQILYGDNGGGNNLTLQYSGPGITQRVVHRSSLCTGIRLAPTSLSYSPNSQTNNYQTAGSSGTPTLGNSNSTTATYSLPSGSPAGITINPATGVLTADNTVAPGSYSLSVTVTNDAGASTFANVFTFMVNAPCGGVDAYGNAAQPGLLAEYYKGFFGDSAKYFVNNTAFALGTTQNPALLKRAESTVNYTTNGAWQTSGLNLFTANIAGNSDAVPTQFSARYRGKLYISTQGNYTFTVVADDAADLVIDGTAAAQKQAAPYTVNNGGNHAATTVTSAAVTLSVGWHNLALLYGNAGGDSYLSLQYAGPGISQQVIPTGLLCTGIVSVPTGLAYSTASQTIASGSTATSVAPTVNNANGPVTSYAVANASSLPAGITINAATGVLTAAATVVPGSYVVSVAATNASGTATFPTVYTFNVLTPGCTGKDAGGNAAQNGLYGEYYAGYFGNSNGGDTDANLAYFTTNTPNFKAVASTLNYTANAAWQTSGLNLFTVGAASNSDAAPTLFSARYRGRLYIATAGSYTLYITSDDGSYLYLDAAALNTPTMASATLKDGGTHGNTTVQATVTLSQGLHDILLLYGNAAGNSSLVLQYSGPGISQQVIPAGVLCSSSGTKPLPVTLVRFEAQTTGTAVAVAWTTASELNSAAFVVERSADGVTFGEEGRMAAAGNSAQARQYQWLDHSPLPGLSYYRLRQLDLDGTAHYSPVASVQRSLTAPQLTLAPNPTTGQVTVRLLQPTAQAATLQVLDALGREVQHLVLPAATQEQALDLHALPAGVYLVRVVSAAGVATQRLVRQ